MSNPPSPVRPASERLRGLILPDLCFGPDLAAALRFATPAGALRAVKRWGVPYSHLGRRLVVRRDALLAWIENREKDPASPWMRALIARMGAP